MEPLNHAKPSQADFISASDIERYGYCPLNWWLKRRGVSEVGPGLKKGTIKHIEVAKDLDKLRQHEDTLQISEFNIKVFGIIAVILAINGIAIITPAQYIGNFLIFSAILWLVVAVMYFEVALRRERLLKKETAKAQKSQPARKPKQKFQPATQPPQDDAISTRVSAEWKRSAILFILIAGVLALNGSTLIFDIDSEILSRILVISALLWLIGTAVMLFFVLRLESKRPDYQKPKDIRSRLRRKLTESEKLIIGFAIVATVLAINGLTIKHRDFVIGMDSFGQILLILAIIWLDVSFLFLYFSFKGGVVSGRLAREFKGIKLKDLKPETFDKIQIDINKLVWEELPESERGALWFAVVALVLGINSILINFAPHDVFGLILEVIALIWLLGASFFLYYALRGSELSSRLRMMHGIKKGKILYTDKIDDTSDILVSEKYNISGRPDSILSLDDKYIPLELKTGRVPKGPYFSHILQIAAYCLLVEETYNKAPPHGIIKYSKNHEFKIDYTPELKSLLLEKVGEIQVAIDGKKVHRNHNRVGKCRYCSRRKKCPERLDKDDKNN